MREKLFLSYSTGDVEWRDRFLKHMRTMLSEKQLFVDKGSLRDGADWRAQLAEELTRSKCALLLLTPQYLAVGNFAQDEELPMLLAEHQKPDGLKLLPVLVENCAYSDRPELARLQLVGWDNNTKSIKRGSDTREVIRPLKEAGDEASTPRAGESAVDQAVKEVCERTRKEFGVIGQITQLQREQLFEKTQAALQSKGVTLDESIRGGDFAVIYRGTYENQEVAVKALPTDAWRNRVSTSFEMAHRTSERLRDASFIRVKGTIADPEVHAMVMEFVDWPTLADEMKQHAGGCLPPHYVVKVLAKISVAQQDAHKICEQIGALSPASVYVNPEGDVRLTPFRIEAQLARGLTMNTGQLVNWDILTMLTPEIYRGRQPKTREELDAHEQYYLALLGLELLIGRRPVEVLCFADLALKARFYRDPRAFFDYDADGGKSWTEECPSLAFVLARMLSEDPADRLDSPSNELWRIEAGKLPESLRRTLGADLKGLMSKDFMSRFYRRLFEARPELRSQFSNVAAQHGRLADAIRDLVLFRPGDPESHFLDYVESHKRLKITVHDIEAFRLAFVAEVIATSMHDGNAQARSHGDAWNAALKLGLGVMAKALATPSAAPIIKTS
jgi:serine/threonine protein kinase